MNLASMNATPFGVTYDSKAADGYLSLTDAFTCRIATVMYLYIST